MLVGLCILALYFWAFFGDVESISTSLLVSDMAAVFAGISVVGSFVSYLWAPKKQLFWGSLAAFTLLTATTAILVLETGGASSPFIALWMLLAVFAGVFGLYGLVPLFGLTLFYMISLFLAGMLTREAIVAIVLTGELPLVASFIIWHNKGQAQESSEKAYSELATEYSQVSNQSDAIINAIGDGVLSLNSQGAIQFINPAAQQLIGWGKQDAISLDYKSVLKLADKNDKEVEAGLDPIAQTLATNKEAKSSDLSITTRSGKKILAAITVSPIGQLGAGAIVVFRDVTKEKAEEREQAEFISTASHEMRTPIASIEGYLGLALNPATAQIDEKARSFIQKAHESAQHLGRLFQDLLDVSKAEDGRLNNNPKVVDVVAFTHDIVEGLQPKAQAKGLRMLFKPQPDKDDDKAGERRLNPVYYANVDNDHLREVLSNLVENAIKYTPKGDVTIDIGGDAEHIVISVADSGIGIPKEDQAHLFQKFYRVDNTATREIGGTGLGLYLSRRLVETMGGRIWLESEFQRGSTFFVELPRVSHEEATRLIESAALMSEATVQPAISTLHVVEPTQAVSIADTGLPQISQQSTVPAQAVSTPIYTPQPGPQAPPQAPQPIPPQYYYQSQAPAPQYQQPYSQPAAPAYSRPLSAAPRPNTPLSSIEQNPTLYTRPQSQPLAPPRNQNQP